nr:hypothetical protein CFP56_00919 [Quercus suber]
MEESCSAVLLRPKVNGSERTGCAAASLDTRSTRACVDSTRDRQDVWGPMCEQLSSQSSEVKEIRTSRRFEKVDHQQVL